MRHKKIKAALLFGGSSAEHEVSLISATSIYRNLDKKKYDVVSIYINKEGYWRIVDSPLLPSHSLKKGKFFSFLPWSKNTITRDIRADIYFPVLHGPCGEDGTIQGLFEMADVPYVGAAVLSSAIGMDKAMAKTLFKMKKLPVVQHFILFESDWKNERHKILSKIKKKIRLPFFVKPTNLGSSVGITKVKGYAQSEVALETAFEYDKKILVEEGIIGREFECSVLGNDNPRVSLPGELIPFREFYDYKDKYIDSKTSFVIPADLPPSVIKEIQRISLEAFKAIDCSGMARVDFFMEEKTARIILNEINTIPGFTEISMYPKLWEVSGISYPKLLDILIELGFERHQQKRRKREPGEIL